MTDLKCVDCPGCGGAGRKYDPAERDPIEGYKLAIRHPCCMCNGSGRIDEQDDRYTAAQCYWETFNKHKAAKEHKERQIKTLQENIKRVALAKLTKREREILGYYDDGKDKRPKDL